MNNQAYENKLRQLIYNSQPIMKLLHTVRACNPPDWLLGAGVIRNLVWDALHEYSEPTPARDVDVAFFDVADLTSERDKTVTHQLMRQQQGVVWEATNQAAVHRWYEEYFGQIVPPFQSSAEAIATWPETATCTAVSLLPNDDLLIVAPFGLDDLFNIILRWNPARATKEQFRQRCKEKQIQTKWPLVQIIDE